ncbi:MAG: ABC transporter ATP-binding protein [Acidobacteriota bacterium]|nr:ABC transporter ATP-binding protein [Blastocatellia bacterium]MDW8238338.1 ABC transporter ATP-binding protein [Acidobacteriota bacterium]
MSESPLLNHIPALQLREVTKQYGRIVAADNVSLTIDREIFGLLGANGAGKSTLMKAILGLIKTDAGQIHVCGYHTRHQPIEAKKRIGYLPEELHLYDRLTGWEFLTFMAGLKGLDHADAIERELDYFGLHEKRHLLIEEYSLGMKKKVGLIAAMMGAPPLILLDEPLNGLDAESMRLLRLRIEELHQRGSTFVISSHVMGLVERLCHRVAVLKRGRIVIEGAPRHLRDIAGMAGEPFEDVFLHFAR